LTWINARLPGFAKLHGEPIPNQIQEENMFLRLLLLSTLPLLTPVTSRAEDVPKEGNETVTITWVSTYASTMKFGDRSRSLYELNGIARNDSGGSMFNNMGQRCLGTTEIVGGKYSGQGTCIETDKDGDQVFSTYEVTGQNAGTTSYVGGTGKFAGFSGTSEWMVTNRPPADDKFGRGVVAEKVHWTRR
jgi:hypothetical protein